MSACVNHSYRRNVWSVCAAIVTCNCYWSACKAAFLRFGDKGHIFFVAYRTIRMPRNDSYDSTTHNPWCNCHHAHLILPRKVFIPLIPTRHILFIIATTPSLSILRTLHKNLAFSYCSYLLSSTSVYTIIVIRKDRQARPWYPRPSPFFSPLLCYIPTNIHRLCDLSLLPQIANGGTTAPSHCLSCCWAQRYSSGHFNCPCLLFITSHSNPSSVSHHWFVALLTSRSQTAQHTHRQSSTSNNTFSVIVDSWSYLRLCCITL